jgi:hypothetical protein
MNKLIIFSSFVVCVMLLIGCNTTTKFDLPDCGISENHLNKEIQVTFINTMNTNKIGDSIYFYVQVKNDIKIVAPKDFNTKLFVLNLENNQWEHIGNSIEYIGSDFYLDSTRKNKPFSVSPIINNKGKTTKIFFCVSGNIVNGENGVEQTVGAYGLVDLQP